MRCGVWGVRPDPPAPGPWTGPWTDLMRAAQPSRMKEQSYYKYSDEHGSGY